MLTAKACSSGLSAAVGIAALDGVEVEWQEGVAQHELDAERRDQAVERMLRRRLVQVGDRLQQVTGDRPQFVTFLLLRHPAVLADQGQRAAGGLARRHAGGDLALHEAQSLDVDG